MAQLRNLIVGCDGTWNEPEETAATNVVKLLNACSARNQVTHYEEGVGTAHWEALPGGIYGKGLDRQILGAYRFLRRRLADRDRAADANRVFIFGFSRGAYAARRLAGLLAHSGLPKQARDVELAWQLYRRRDAASVVALKGEGRLFAIPVAMLGVWDTVKTTIDDDFNDFRLPACVARGYHALALDEQRRFFPALKWDAEERVRQAWFPGVHSDIGGGYAECGLSDIALQWMLDRAHENGLRIKASAVKRLKPDPCGLLHNSCTGIWTAFGTQPRTINAAETIHDAARQRMAKLAGYRPSPLSPA